MPELPEVQTIINDLNEKIIGDAITDFWSDWPKAIKNTNEKNPASSADEFSKKIQNRKILGARRIGKNIFIDLTGEKTIYIHLKMTGHLLVKKKEVGSKKKEDFFEDRVNQYIHHKFYLGKNKTLEFSDLRKFGKIVLLNTKEVVSYKDIKTLGADAMSVEFTFKKFSEILKNYSRRPIGILLMEQNLISGIGNIYRSEILFDAKIRPTKRVVKITGNEREKLYVSIKKILKKAIKYRGTSDSDYRDTAGAPGNYQKVILVYHREKQKCQKCGTIIKRLKLGQRSVFYCPGCQK